MNDYLLTAARLRADAELPEDAAIDVEILLPRLVPADCVRLEALGVETMRGWLNRHQAVTPPSLAVCHDRPLRGGVIAWRGYGLLFADKNDSAEEIRFTLAHEAHHFLHEHFYPRLDLLNRFGERIRPVMDGERPPVREERIDAILARTSLAIHAHLLDRNLELPPEIAAIEDDADAFACEILAPAAVLENLFPNVTRESEPAITDFLRETFHLPEFPAADYARRFVAERAEPPSLLHRLRLVT